MRFTGFAILVLLLVGPTVTWADGQHPRENTFMKRQWGVEVLFVRQASAGYMLSFATGCSMRKRHRLYSNVRRSQSSIHNETGARMIVPTPAKTGALRNSNPPKTGNVYWMFFANPGKLVESGDTVNIEIGDFVAEDLTVE